MECGGVAFGEGRTYKLAIGDLIVEPLVASFVGKDTVKFTGPDITEGYARMWKGTDRVSMGVVHRARDGVEMATFGRFHDGHWMAKTWFARTNVRRKSPATFTDACGMEWVYVLWKEIKEV